MKIKIIKSEPIDSQESIDEFIGKIYDVIDYDVFYPQAVAKGMKEKGEVAVYLNEHDKAPSIINKNEYVIIG